MRLSKLHRAWIYASFGLLLATGVVWFVLDRACEIEGEFGPEKHPWAGPVLAAHGALAWVAAVVIGSLLPLHVRGAWRARRNRRSGVSTLVWNGALIVTGWLLYYSGSETLRAGVAWTHLGLGVTLPWVVAFHVVSGRRRTRTRRREAEGGEP